MTLWGPFIGIPRRWSTLSVVGDVELQARLRRHHCRHDEQALRPRLALTTALAVGSSARVSGADWPSFRGPAHDGKSVEAIPWPKAGPRPVWKINVAIGHSAVCVVGDRACTMGNTNDTDTVFAIDVSISSTSRCCKNGM